MSNNYMNIGFRLELDPQYWSDSYGIQETDKEKLSALLHEYIFITYKIRIHITELCIVRSRMTIPLTIQ